MPVKLKDVESPHGVSPSTLPFLMEVVGPSGSGKSSIVRAIVDEGGGEFRAGRVGSEVGFTGIVRSAGHAAAAFVPQLLRVPTRPWYRFHISVQLQTHAELLRQGGEGVVVLDQGPVYLLSILQRALRRDGTDSPRFLRYWEETLTSWASALRLVVMLDAADEVLHERVIRRGTPHPLLGKSISAASQTLLAARRSRSAVLQALRQRNPSLPVLHLPVGELSTSELAGQIRGYVNELIGSSIPELARSSSATDGDLSGRET